MSKFLFFKKKKKKKKKLHLEKFLDFNIQY